MGTFSIWHWLVVLAVLVLLFGPKKLPGLGRDLAAAIRGFKQGMKEDSSDKAALEQPQAEVTATETRAEEHSKPSS